VVPRIYTPAELAVGASITLEKSASAHVAKVLRLSPGDAVIAFNGNGDDHRAEIVEVGKRVRVRIRARARNTSESPLRIVLVQGISRSDRMDFALQKSVELGIVEFQAVVTEKSSVRLDAVRMDKKVRHWQAVAISAAEQCGRSTLVAIKTPITLMQWLDSANAAKTVITLEPAARKTLRDCAIERECALLIGPESGFSPREVAQIQNRGMTLARPGPRVLRTETAAVAAVTALQTLYGDLTGNL